MVGSLPILPLPAPPPDSNPPSSRVTADNVSSATPPSFVAATHTRTTELVQSAGDVEPVEEADMEMDEEQVNMQPRPPMGQVIPGPMTMKSSQQCMMMNKPPQLAQPISPPPPPASLYPPHWGIRRHFIHLAPPPSSSMHHGMPPPPPPEPESKRQKVGDQLILEEQFLDQYPGPVRIAVAIPNVNELNLRGRLSEIAVQSLSETIGNFKEKIAAETQIAGNKQILRGRIGFLRDYLSLAFYNIGAGETLTLALRERGGGTR